MSPIPIHPAVIVAGDISLSQTLQRIRDEKNSRVVVELGELEYGLVSESDLIYQLAISDKRFEPARIDSIVNRVSVVAGPADREADLLDQMIRCDAAIVPFVDGDRIAGVVLRDDLLQSTGRLLPYRWLQAPAEHFLARPVATVEAHTPLDMAIQQMKESKRGALVVVDRHRKPIGMVTERDFVSYVLASTKPLDQIVIEELMASGLPFVYQTDPLAVVLPKLLSVPYRHIAVVDREDRTVGLIGIDDVSRYREEELERVVAERVSELSRSRDQIEIEKRRLQNLLEIAQTFTLTMSALEALDETTKKIQGIVDGVSRCSIMLVGDTADTLHIVACLTESGRPDENFKIALDRYPEVKLALAERRSITIREIGTSELYLAIVSRLPAEVVRQSVVVEPLIFDDRMMGVLFVRADKNGKGFSKEERNFLLASASSISTFLQLKEYRDAELESHLVQWKEYYERIIEDMSSAVAVLDDDDKVQFVNRALTTLTGLTRWELLGKSIHAIELFRESGTFDWIGSIFRHDASSKSTISFRQGSATRWLDIAGANFHDPTSGRIGKMLVIDDVTQRHELEQKIAMAQRYAEIGRITRQLGHEIRNPLHAIGGIGQLMQSGPMAPDQINKFGEVLQDEVDRLNQLLEGLSDYSRADVLELDKVDLNKDVLQKVSRLIELDAKAIGHQIVSDFEENLPPVWADGFKLEQVFLNLAKNGVQAMSTRGRLLLSSRRIGQDLVEIVVADEGHGIDPAIADQIFDLLFTTKGSQGSGIGLALVKRYIEAHRGTIDFTSEVGRGTRFVITLPVGRDGEFESREA